jgi:hypothetical protein
MPEVRSAELNTDSPLNEGENVSVSLANEKDIEALDTMTEARSWDGNSYVRRARDSLLDNSRGS